MNASRMQIFFSGESHRGRDKALPARELQFCGEMRTPQGETFTLGMVVDGYGLQGLGERAAQLAIESIRASLSQANLEDPLQALKNSIEAANTRLYQLGVQHKQKVLATIAVALIHRGKLYVANVGNNRIYLIHRGEISQITLEHTWALERIRRAGVEPHQALADPKAQELSRALGVEQNVEVDLGLYLQRGQENDAQAVAQQGFSLTEADTILICSDGIRARHPQLANYYISLDEIKSLGNMANPIFATNALRQMGKKRRIPEDISMVILKASTQPVPAFQSKKKKVALSLGLALLFIFGCLALFFGGIVVYQNRSELTSFIGINESTMATIRQGNPQLIQNGQVQRTLQVGEQIALAAGNTLSTEEETVIVNLPGGEDVYLKGAAQSPSQVEFNRYQKRINKKETQLGFLSGSMFITFNATEAQENSSLIQTIYGEVEFTHGIMGIRLDAEHNRVVVDCVVGTCTLNGKNQSNLTLESGQQSWFEADGAIHTPVEFMDLSAYPQYPFLGSLVTSTSTQEALSPTPTHTPEVELSPTFTSTATATRTPTITATPPPTKKPEDLFPPGFPPPPTEDIFPFP